MTTLKKTPAATAAGQVDLTGLVAHTGVNMRHGATLQQITGNGVKENGHTGERQAQFIRPWVNPRNSRGRLISSIFPFHTRLSSQTTRGWKTFLPTGDSRTSGGPPSSFWSYTDTWPPPAPWCTCSQPPSAPTCRT